MLALGLILCSSVSALADDGMQSLGLPAAYDGAFRMAEPVASEKPVFEASGARTLTLSDADAFRVRVLNWQGISSQRSPQTPLSPLIFASPLNFMRTSSTFGLRADPYLGTVRLHAGVDVPGAIGTPVRVSADGVVMFAGVAHGYGNMVEVMHGGGLQTRYAHLSRILVSQGEPLLRGSVIGLMGSTGRSTGSHLHFEVRLDGRPLDPFSFLGKSFTSAAVPENVYPLSPLQPSWASWRSNEPDRLPSVQRK
jgi:murein DD-endopeptidase MepM/ murein hydrolase activator NlpD